MRKSTWILAAAVLVLLASAGCATAPKSAEGKVDIEKDAADALAKARAGDPTFAPVLRDAYGYAVFPSVGKGGIGIGGAYGRGVLYRNGTAIGYCKITQGTIGLQLGAQTYTEMIVFATREAFDNFKSGNFAFDAQATVVALKSGAGANAKYSNGVAVFTMAETGLMYEASVGGQKFDFQAK
ncbi:MAG: lipid-binding SYLF domain-containing protein [Candidatus Krumholzibacteriia bacterium]